MSRLTVGELRKLLDGLPDSVPVIIHNDGGEWYGYDEAPRAKVDTLFSFRSRIGDRYYCSAEDVKGTGGTRLTTVVIDFV